MEPLITYINDTVNAAAAWNLGPAGARNLVFIIEGDFPDKMGLERLDERLQGAIRQLEVR